MPRALRPDPPSPRVQTLRMRGFLIGFNLLLLAFAIWALIQTRRDFIRSAEATTNNLAQVLEQNVQGTIRQIDLALLAIRDEAERHPDGPRHPGLASFVQARFRRQGLLDALQIVDEQGRILQSTPAGLSRDLGARAFFHAMKEDPRARLHISRPVRDGAGGAWAILLARRLDDAEGRFAGAICATLPTNQLSRAMSLMDVGPGGSVSLRAEDLSLLLRYPTQPGQDGLIGNTQVFDDYLAAVRSSAPVAHFRAASRLDGRHRTYTLRAFGTPRFHVLVGLAEDDYLRAWRREAAFVAVAIAILTGLTLYMGWVARSAWRQQLESQARLAQEEAKYRLLAENATDVIWSLDLEGRITYISPSILRQRGWTPEEFMALKPDQWAISKETAEEIQRRLASLPHLPPGAQPFEKDLLQTALKRKDGEEIQVESQWRIVWTEDGRVLGLQGVTRDITMRKRLETEREALIQDLTRALAEVRALKGMLPICSQCKKVRDDQGYWNQIETYLSEHTEATFTHGVCPDCAAAFRREMQARREQKGEDQGQG